MLKLCVTFLLSFVIKKPTFVSADSCCYIINGNVFASVQDSYIASSLWNYYTQEKVIYLRPKNALHILLLLCGDVELCPEPEFLPQLSNLTKASGLKVLKSKHTRFI